MAEQGSISVLELRIDDEHRAQLELICWLEPGFAALEDVQSEKVSAYHNAMEDEVREIEAREIETRETVARENEDERSNSQKKHSPPKTNQPKSSQLRIYFEDELTPERQASFQSSLQEVPSVENLNWTTASLEGALESYQKQVSSSDIGDFIIEVPWNQLEQKKRQSLSQHTLRLEPGLAFGTGDHPTTQMCLNHLASLSRNFPDWRHFLDYGAGSGILSIAIRKLWPQAQIWSIEIDSLCEENFKKNCQLNDLDPGSFHCYFGRRAEKEAKLLELKFDCVVSNIFSEILRELSSTILDLLKDDGVWLLSGILKGKGEESLASSLDKSFSMSSREMRLDPRYGDRWLCWRLVKNNKEAKGE